MDLTGRTLGGYRLLERLARGGMADVYKARQESLGRTVALKVLPSTLHQDHTFQARFEQEARSVAQLHHPNILKVFDYGESDGLSYIVTEYVPGGTLEERLHRPLSLGEAIAIICRLGEALDYAHRHGVIHRDVKPSNVLLTEEDWPLLSDFGLVKIAQESKGITRPSASMGTPEYMSPEQGQGQPVDHRTDVYALGALLYELVTGRTPFSAESPVGLILKHTTEPLPSPRLHRPDLPHEIEAVMVKAMSKKPDDRYASADQMVRALQVAWQQAQNETSVLDQGTRFRSSSLVRSPQSARSPYQPSWRTFWIALLAPILLVSSIRLAWIGIPPVDGRSAQAEGSVKTTPNRMNLATPTFTPLPLPTETALPTATATPFPLATSTPALATPPGDMSQAVARTPASLLEGPNEQTEELDLISQPSPLSTTVTDRTTQLLVTPGPLEIKHVWPFNTCDAQGNWTVIFQVRISGGDGKNYALYWEDEQISYTVKPEEQDVAIIQRRGGSGMLVGTVWVESGKQRASMVTSVARSCESESTK